MNELALFAGAGGGILGGHLLGWRTVCAVERDAFAAAVLAQRQNDGCLEPFPIWSDVETFDGRPWRGIVDIVSGGFPCTDISCAGKGAGIDGEASGLWREMARIIGEVRPRHALVENSPMLTVRGLGRVLGDLAAMGYDAQWGVLSAADAIWADCLSRGDRPALDHLRERIWIVATIADTDCDGRETRSAGRFDRTSLQPHAVADDQVADGGGRREQHDAGLGNVSELDAQREDDDAAGSRRTPRKTGARRQSRSEGGMSESQRRDRACGDFKSTDAAKQPWPVARRQALVDRWVCPESTNSALGRLAMRWWSPGESGHADGVCAATYSAPRKDDGRDGRILGGETRERESGNAAAWDGRKTPVNSDDAGREQQRMREPIEPTGWWTTEPDVGRLVHGLADRVDRCKALGNGQVPAVVRLAWRMLTE